MKESREFLTDLGTPLGKSGRRRLERIYRPEKIDPGLVSNRNRRAFQELLASIDFTFLEEIFRQIAIKSGIDPQKTNFLGTNRIKKGALPGENEGTYYTEANIIILDHERISHTAKEYGVDVHDYTVMVVTHEECHATQKNECWVTNDTNKKPSRIFQIKSGYQLVNDEGWFQREGFFGQFNEGVTEKLSREVARAYAARDGSAALARMNKTLNRVGTYHDAVRFVDAFIDKISKETGMLQETVWHAVVRGAYEGETFDQSELRKLLEEIFGEGFVEKLGRATIGDMLRLLEDTKIGSGPQKRIRTLASLVKLAHAFR